MRGGGRRRGGAIGVLDVDHPDVLEFIKAKESGGLENFNLSVRVSNDWMSRVKEGRSAEVEVWKEICEQAWRTGDPGLLFAESLNRDNPCPHLGECNVTNPCGELVLPPPFACNLGSIDLSKFCVESAVGGWQQRIDWSRLKEVIHTAVRFLDCAIDVASYPFKDVEERMKALRPVGLGVMGYADLLLKLGIRYGSEEALAVADKLGEVLKASSQIASMELRREKGSPPECEDRRNALLNAIAPTGTLSIIAGTSPGIEPVYAWECQRTIVTTGEVVQVVHPLYDSVKGATKLPDYFVTAHEVTPEEHVRTLATWQRWIDGGVSKTVNLPNSATVEEVGQAFMLAWETGCKGITVFRDGCRESQVLKGGRAGKRPRSVPGVTHRIKVGCGTLWVTINELNGAPYETFVQTGDAGGCPAQSKAIGKLLSLALQHGISCEKIVDRLKGIRCMACVRSEEAEALSCPDAVVRLLDGSGGEKKGQAHSQTGGGSCPVCGSDLVLLEGCYRCLSCSFSRCG